MIPLSGITPITPKIVFIPEREKKEQKEKIMKETKNKKKAKPNVVCLYIRKGKEIKLKI